MWRNGFSLEAIRQLKAGDSLPLNRFTGSDLQGASFRSAKVRLDFSQSNLKNADLSGALLLGGSMAETCLTDAQLVGSHLASIDLSTATGDRVDLRKAELDTATLWHANESTSALTQVRSEGAKLPGAPPHRWSERPTAADQKVCDEFERPRYLKP
jgi:uncharacterized protein YjbI with pentapeptide repeats